MVDDEAIRALRVAELPALEERVFLDHASVGPIPRSHAQAAAEVLERHAEHGPAAGEATRLLEDARTAAARLLHADPRSIALLRSTGEGLSLLARGLDWREGDEVILYEREFVACVAPFAELRAEGVRIRWIPDRGERFELDDVERLLGPRTRAVCVSVVNRSHGLRAPVEELAALCRERGVWLALDAAQAMGVLDLDAPALGADVIAAHGYKFLCSGFGLAVVHCSDRAISELRAPLVGWKNVALDEAGGLAVAPEGEARRFEPTMSSAAGLAGVGASLALLNGLEHSERERRAVALAGLLAGGAAERGYEVVSSRRPGEESTLVALRHPSLAASEVEAVLATSGVACAVVDGAVRLATHAFNIADDIEHAVATLPAVG